jgi:hypothetical protein
VVAVALDLMVVALALVAQRFTRMAAVRPVSPVLQGLRPQGVLGAQEIQHLNPLFMVAQGA